LIKISTTADEIARRATSVPIFTLTTKSPDLTYRIMMQGHLQLLPEIVDLKIVLKVRAYERQS
jgi:hypothetical protein